MTTLLLALAHLHAIFASQTMGVGIVECFTYVTSNRSFCRCANDFVKQLSDILAELAANPSPEILDSLRGLERKTSLVFTLIKGSVYSIVLNLQDQNSGGEAQ